MPHRPRWISVLSVSLLVCFVCAGPAADAASRVASADRHPASTRLFVPPPDPDGVLQVLQLFRAHEFRDALRLTRMIIQPQAVWFDEGDPVQVFNDVRRTMWAAARQHAVPVLVAYNLPFRDCSQFSAGGATDTEEYLTGIDAFARGIGGGRAIVILEPDGLGIIPFYTDINGVMEWCQPAEADPATAAADRFLQLNAAVDRLNEQPNVSVFLDGTHSSWLGVGDAARRLVDAGALRAAGFFVNVSNYRPTEHLVKYGTWISKCIAFANNPEEGGWRLGHYDYCASQYFPANPNDFSTWHLSDEWYDANLGTAVPTAHFVIDTSRNGQGPWTPPAGVYPDPQDWCNPPGRGTGLRPTAATGIPLLDAYLWVKLPGQSDGQCNRGLGDPGTAPDSEWAAITGDPGFVDPAAGDWFPQQALQLAQLANPPLA